MLPVLHVGFHKSGSTTLQGALFSRHPEIANLGEPEEDPNALKAVRIALLSCHRRESKRRPFDLEAARRLWGEAIAGVAPGKVPVFSKETLTMFEYYQSANDRSLPEKLHAIIGPARIVIMVRQQFRLVESLYLYTTRGSSYQTPDEWLCRKGEGLLHMYRFHEVAKTFADIFGRENVGVFLLEDLKNDTGDFGRRLCEFIGVAPQAGAALLQDERRNARVSQRYLAYSKLRKRLGLFVPIGGYLPAPAREAIRDFVRGGREAKVALPAEWIAEMEPLYRDDNRRLAGEWGLPLEKYDYPI